MNIFFIVLRSIDILSITFLFSLQDSVARRGIALICVAEARKTSALLCVASVLQGGRWRTEGVTSLTLAPPPPYLSPSLPSSLPPSLSLSLPPFLPSFSLLTTQDPLISPSIYFTIYELYRAGGRECVMKPVILPLRRGRVEASTISPPGTVTHWFVYISVGPSRAWVGQQLGFFLLFFSLFSVSRILSRLVSFVLFPLSVSLRCLCNFFFFIYLFNCFFFKF